MSQNNAIKINKYFKFAIKHIFIKLIKHIMIFFQNIKIYKRINCCIKWVFPPAQITKGKNLIIKNITVLTE